MSQDNKNSNAHEKIEKNVGLLALFMVLVFVVTIVRLGASTNG